MGARLAPSGAAAGRAVTMVTRRHPEKAAAVAAAAEEEERAGDAHAAARAVAVADAAVRSGVGRAGGEARGRPAYEGPGGQGRPRGAPSGPPPPEPPGLGPHPGLRAAGPAAAELQKRVQELERSLQFVQRQHADTLLGLHAEVERLRRANRDLHYQLIMNQKAQRKGMTSGSSFLKSNSVVVSTGCSASKVRHSLCCPKRQEAEESGEEEQDPSTREDTEALIATGIPMMSCQPQVKHIQGGMASLKLPPHMQKLSTLQQCEMVIRQLWNANHLQAQELQHLKSALEESTRQATDSLPVSHSKRALGEKKKLISVCSLQGPVAGQTFSSLRHQEGMQFPKVADKNSAKKCLILAPIPGAERAVLPALKQTLRNNFAERQKKLQALQSRRLHRTVL
ncbi:coiled-coil domain-containing protein 74B [Macrotis lagotis]|uniref:coiled-coil domain-containing protein 74B n=1 Tax=Macrotis lagotis TaxID=92651 RepID=UPI003D68B47D